MFWRNFSFSLQRSVPQDLNRWKKIPRLVILERPVIANQGLKKVRFVSFQICFSCVCISATLLRFFLHEITFGASPWIFYHALAVPSLVWDFFLFGFFFWTINSLSDWEGGPSLMVTACASHLLPPLPLIVMHSWICSFFTFLRLPSVLFLPSDSYQHISNQTSKISKGTGFRWVCISVFCIMIIFFFSDTYASLSILLALYPKYPTTLIPILLAPFMFYFFLAESLNPKSVPQKETRQRKEDDDEGEGCCFPRVVISFDCFLFPSHPQFVQPPHFSVPLTLIAFFCVWFCRTITHFSITIQKT